MEIHEFELRSDDETVKNCDFQSYRSTTLRHAVRYNPANDEPEEIALQTPWGEQLTCRKGDYIVSETTGSSDRWPVSAEIFEQTYVEIQPEYYIKRALVHLAPLTKFTAGDPDSLVAIHTLEGTVRVRSGDFFLARGVKGEIWPIPQEKVAQAMMLVEDENSPAGN